MKPTERTKENMLKDRINYSQREKNKFMEAYGSWDIVELKYNIM